MNTITQFTIPQSQQDWKKKFSKLQNELLQARIQQINLKRINRNLQETLRIAIDQQSKKQCQSTRRINLTWKEKYQMELQKNMENQKYIKVLQSQRNTLSFDKKCKKRQNSMSVRNTLKTEVKPRKNSHMFYSNQQNQHNARMLSRDGSVKKMQSFMDRLLKEKYSISQFGHDNYGNMGRIQNIKTKPIYYNQDPIQKVFGSLKPVAKQNIYRETEQEQLPLRTLKSIKQNTTPFGKLSFQKQTQNVLNKKLRLTPHLR